MKFLVSYDFVRWNIIYNLDVFGVFSYFEPFFFKQTYTVMQDNMRLNIICHQ